MADDIRLYRARAEAEHANAAAAALDNARERATRAANAWTAMADRAERTQTLRLTREAATAAARDEARDLAPSDSAQRY